MGGVSVRVQVRWLAGILLVAVGAAGWFGWRQAKWRQAFYVETTSQLIYQLDMAERSLVRSRESGNYQEKLEAMASAGGYLYAAQVEANALMKQMAPFRKGKPVYMPAHGVLDLIQYAQNLTPDLPDAALQKRIELLDGLGKALATGLPGRAGEPGNTYTMDVFQVKLDLPALRQSLNDYFRSLIEPGDVRPMPTFEDEPNKPTVTARRQGSDVVLRVEWTRSYQLFPRDWEGRWVLARLAGGGAVTATSDAGIQQRMGMGAFEPVETVTLTADQHEAWKDRLPAGWTVGSYVVIRLPEGLNQTVTVRGTEGELHLLRPRSGENAAVLPVQP